MSRQSRLAEQIRRELSLVVQMELRDPRLGSMTTISAVELSRDLSVAKVFFTVFEEEKIKDTKAALESASGFLRKHLANTLSMRALPKLTFFYDESVARGRHISSLIDGAISNDKDQRADDTATDSGSELDN